MKFLLTGPGFVLLVSFFDLYLEIKKLGISLSSLWFRVIVFKTRKSMLNSNSTGPVSLLICIVSKIDIHSSLYREFKRLLWSH